MLNHSISVRGRVELLGGRRESKMGVASQSHKWVRFKPREILTPQPKGLV